MKKNRFLLILIMLLTVSICLSGCRQKSVDIILNVDDFESIVLATENTIAAPLPIPISSEKTQGGSGTETDSTDDNTAEETDPNTYDTSDDDTEPPYTVPTEEETEPPVITTSEEQTEPPVITTTEEETDPPVVTTTETETDPPVVTATDPETSEDTAPPPETTIDESDLTPIMGKRVATVEQMRAFIRAVNPDVDQKIIDMIPFYLSEGEKEGVRGDIAFAQSCVETGYFRFDKAGTGSAVTIDQNNFCGMGVTFLGAKGESFETPQIGIRAQIQHLKAYGSTLNLNGECVDPRFHYVVRGCAKYWEWLGMQENPNHLGWAGGANYGPIIMEIYNRILTY